jgi:hypothetical protein
MSKAAEIKAAAIPTDSSIPVGPVFNKVDQSYIVDVISGNEAEICLYVRLD